MGLFNIYSFNIIYFRKFVESMKGSTIQAGLTAFFKIQPEGMFNPCFNFKEPQSTYTYNCCAYIKKSEESLVTFHLCQCSNC